LRRRWLISILCFLALAVAGTFAYVRWNYRGDRTERLVRDFIELWSDAAEDRAVQLIEPGPTFDAELAARTLRAIRAQLGAPRIDAGDYAGGQRKIYGIKSYSRENARDATYRIAFSGGAKVHARVRFPRDPANSGAVLIGGLEFFGEVGDASIEKLCAAAVEALIK